MKTKRDCAELIIEKIPSPDMRKYLREIFWEPSVSEMATIVCNLELTDSDRIEILIGLCGCVGDGSLKSLLDEEISAQTLLPERFNLPVVSLLRRGAGGAALPSESSEIIRRRYVHIPHPFKTGDRVRVIISDRVGTINYDPEIMKTLEERHFRGEIRMDWTDVAVTVMYRQNANGYPEHDHINPIFLEYVDR